MKYKHKPTGLTYDFEIKPNTGMPVIFKSKSDGVEIFSGFVKMGNDWEKIEDGQHLFKSEDQFNIYEGDKVYVVSKKHWQLYNGFRIATAGYPLPSATRAVFATKTAAELYIHEHKLRFSVKQLEDAVRKIYPVSAKDEDFVKRFLKTLLNDIS